MKRPEGEASCLKWSSGAQMPIHCLSGIFLESVEQDCEENWHSSVTCSPGIHLQPSEAALESAPWAENLSNQPLPTPPHPNSSRRTAQQGPTSAQRSRWGSWRFSLTAGKEFLLLDYTDVTRCEVNTEGSTCAEVDCYFLDLWNEMILGEKNLMIYKYIRDFISCDL